MSAEELRKCAEGTLAGLQDAPSHANAAILSIAIYLAAAGIIEAINNLDHGEIAKVVRQLLEKPKPGEKDYPFDPLVET